VGAQVGRGSKNEQKQSLQEALEVRREFGKKMVHEQACKTLKHICRKSKIE